MYQVYIKEYYMLKYSLSFSLFASASLMAESDTVPTSVLTQKTPVVSTLAEAFEQGTVSGQVRSGYVHSTPQTDDPTATAAALGGQLKFETASLHGLSVGAALYTSHTISELSGNKARGEFYDELGDPFYDLLAESYLNYEHDDLNIRIGRQLIDTPYADSDDIRMTPNTFQGSVASYTIDNISFMAAYLTRWQGPDADDFKFNKLLPNSEGTALVSATYETDATEVGAWFYNMENIMNIYYTDASYTHTLNQNTSLKGAVQVGHQEEINNSGFQGTLYGAMAELGLDGLTLGVAFNHTEVLDGREYFTGLGGGAGFVNMFEMTATVLTLHHDTTAWKGSIAYDFSSLGAKGLSLAYDYGDFQAGEDYEAKEQNFTFSYAPSKEWDIEAIYARVDDIYEDIGEDQTDYSFDILIVRANYNF